MGISNRILKTSRDLNCFLMFFVYFLGSKSSFKWFLKFVNPSNAMFFIFGYKTFIAYLKIFEVNLDLFFTQCYFVFFSPIRKNTLYCFLI